MPNKNNNSIDIDDWAYIITVISGPFSLVIAALLALIAAFIPAQPNQADRSKDLMQFATLLFGGGAAVTGTTQPRRRNFSNNVNLEDTSPSDTNNIASANSGSQPQQPVDNSQPTQAPSEVLQPLEVRQK